MEASSPAGLWFPGTRAACLLGPVLMLRDCLRHKNEQLLRSVVTDQANYKIMNRCILSNIKIATQNGFRHFSPHFVVVAPLLTENRLFNQTAPRKHEAIEIKPIKMFN